jgi:LacI family transcriptional regulator
MTTDEHPPRRFRVAFALEMSYGFRRHQDTFAGAHAYAEEAGWECFIHPSPDRIIKPRTGGLGFDGIVARATPNMAAAARQAGIPMVNVWMNSPVKDIPSVFPDASAAGEMAAAHLLGRGFRNFGYLGYKKDVDSRNQLAGFRGAVEAHGLSCTVHQFIDEDLDGPAPGWERFISGLEEWVDSWTTPIGIYVTQDLNCRYLIDVCRNKGLYVSQDVAIIGTGNESVICDAPPPTLTSIDLGYTRVGHRAASLLHELMSGAEPPKEPILVAPAELVPRQSTDVFAASDPMVSRALRFMAEHSHERIEVKTVVSAVATNRRSLERRFRQSIGKSIAEEITRLRLERAKRRIVETDAPMKDIALEVGFRNADHFYKVFSRVEGMPPSQFREERQRLFPRN